MASIYDYSAIEDGIKYSIILSRERTFTIRVNDRVQEYQTLYPNVFGINGYDRQEIEKILNRMIRQEKGELKNGQKEELHQ